MAITLTVDNIPFEYPAPGETAPWGEGATDWAERVTYVLNTLKGPADILETGANILNDQRYPADVTDMKFNASIVRSFKIEGNITRTYDSNSKYEEFTIVGLHNGSGWDLQQDGMGDAGVTFSITSSGQIQYSSTDLTYTISYSGLCKFRGIAILTT